MGTLTVSSLQALYDKCVEKHVEGKGLKIHTFNWSR